MSIATVLRVALPRKQLSCGGSLLIKCERLIHASSSSAANSFALEQVKKRTQAVAPTPAKPKVTMEPFVKNLFLNKIDTNILAYPELDIARVNILQDMVEEVKHVMGGVDSCKIDEQAKLPQEVLLGMKNLGIFGLSVPQEYGGLGFTNTEMVRLAEVFGRDLSLFYHLNTHLSHVVTTLSRHASEEQKSKLLPQLASGDLQCGIALWEENAGTDLLEMECTAMLLGDEYHLSGKKQWVSNAGADKLLVFAKETNKSSDSHKKGNFVCLLVDKHSPGITAQSMDTTGVRGFNLWEVKFDRTPVPVECVIGKSGKGVDIAMEILNDKFTLIGGAYTGILRELLDLTVQHAIKREVFGSPIKDHEAVKHTISQVALGLYTMESMSYLSASFIDEYENPDCSVEAAIVKLYCTEMLLTGMQKCFSILGSQTLLKNQKYEHMMRDAQFAPFYENNTNVLRMYIAMMCLDHAGKSTQEEVTMARNPFFYPKESVNRAMKSMFFKFDPETSQKRISYHVHPSMEINADHIEACIQLLGKATWDGLEKWGSEMIQKQMDLLRFADMAVDCFAGTAVLARASRSICIGLRDADYESFLSQSFAYEAYHRVKHNFNLLNHSPFMNNDSNYCKISDSLVRAKGYKIAHPLSRNF